MIYKAKVFLLGCLLSFPLVTYGQASHNIRPRWIKNYHNLQRDGANYQLILVESNGPSLGELQKGRLTALGTYLKSSNQIDGEIDWNASTKITDSDFQASSVHSLSFKTKSTVETFNCKLVDDYWEAKYGLYNYYALFAVTEPGTLSPIDDFIRTSSYASDPATWGLALIPGAAQFHKGSYLKGGLILGGSVVLVGGIIFTENQRSDYVKKIAKTHDANVKRAYATRRDHFATGRNICIGAAAALYVYNLIDAIIAPGARRVVVQKGTGGNTYAFTPSILDGYAPGMTVAMTF